MQCHLFNHWHLTPTCTCVYPSMTFQLSRLHHRGIVSTWAVAGKRSQWSQALAMWTESLSNDKVFLVLLLTIKHQRCYNWWCSASLASRERQGQELLSFLILRRVSYKYGARACQGRTRAGLTKSCCSQGTTRKPFAGLGLNEKDMADSLRRLVNSSSFSLLQQKLESWYKDYHVSQLKHKLFTHALA